MRPIPQTRQTMRKFALQSATAVLGLCGFACLLLFVGCASPAKGKAMKVAGFKATTRHPSKVLVQVTGGQETVPIMVNVPEVSSDAFREALDATIEGSGLFAQAVSHAPADYRLEVSIVEAKQKGAWTTATTMTTRWQFTRSSDGKKLFDEFIESSGHAKVTLGPARLRRSLECAGRENIKGGLTKLAQVDLQ
jgi:hypothetical protein